MMPSPSLCVLLGLKKLGVKEEFDSSVAWLCIYILSRVSGASLETGGLLTMAYVT